MSAFPVSIVIPVLNEGKAIIETIGAIEAAADLPQELVIVDDGSTDGCCDELRDSSCRRRIDVTLVTQERRGVAEARNAGAAVARQPFIVFLDGHCSVQSGWLSTLIHVLDNRTQAIACPAVRDGREPHYVGCGATLVDQGLRYRWIPARGEQPAEVGMIPGGCMALPRALFEDLGAFDRMKHYGFEDVEFCLRAWRLGVSLLAVPTARIEHRFRSAQPFDVPRSSFVYNAIRTAILHFSGERLKLTLDRLSTNPEFARQTIELLAGDVIERKSFIDARACRDIDEYFKAFPSGDPQA